MNSGSKYFVIIYTPTQGGIINEDIDNIKRKFTYNNVTSYHHKPQYSNLQYRIHNKSTHIKVYVKMKNYTLKKTIIDEYRVIFLNIKAYPVLQRHCLYL